MLELPFNMQQFAKVKYEENGQPYILKLYKANGKVAGYEDPVHTRTQKIERT